jgi:hypothetical protein
MTQYRQLAGLTTEQRHHYNTLADEQARKLYLESVSVVDLTSVPTPESAAQQHPLPYSFLPDDVDTDSDRQTLRHSWEQFLVAIAAGKEQRHLRELVNLVLHQQQVWFDRQTQHLQQIVEPLTDQQRRLEKTIGELPEKVLKPADVQSAIREQVDTHWQDVPDHLSREVETFVKKLIPAVVRVENPTDNLLRLTRSLAVGLVAAGLGLGGLFFWGLTRQARLNEQTPDWSKYQYLTQKAQAEGDKKLLDHLNQAERVYRSGTFSRALSRLKSVNSARQQQQRTRLEERMYPAPSRQNER